MACLGALYPASCDRTCSRNPSSPMGAVPGFCEYTATTRLPRRSSGNPTTRAVLYIIVPLDGLLNLFREHFFTTGVDALRPATQKCDASIRLDCREVSGEGYRTPLTVRKVRADFSSSCSNHEARCLPSQPSPFRPIQVRRAHHLR